MFEDGRDLGLMLALRHLLAGSKPKGCCLTQRPNTCWIKLWRT
jgi:hypothetical protein